MASDLNSVVLVGRLTRDPELRSLTSGNSVCSLRVAFTTSRKTPSGYEDESNYVDVTVWGNQGENVARYTSKGSKVGIQGNLSWREFQTQGGDKRQTLEIVARQVQFLDPPSGNGGGSQRSSDVPADDVSWGGGGEQSQLGGGGGQPDDDIPF